MTKVFLSYSRDDLETVLALEQALVASGVEVWRDQQSLYGGQLWPKALGEAVASSGALLLVWSKNAAESYYVELEWNTALALKKPVLPCRLDDAPLPQFLKAFNAIDCRNVEVAVPNILAALRLQTMETDAKLREDVITKLQSIKADDPKQVLREAKVLFNQEARNVIGDVHQYHAERDLHVTIKKESSLTTWVAIVISIVSVGIAAAFFTSFNRERKAPSQDEIKPAPAEQHNVYLKGFVRDSAGIPIPNAEVSIEESAGTLIVEPVTTASFGDFSLDNIPEKFGSETIRVFVRLNGKVKYSLFLTGLPRSTTIKFNRRGACELAE